MGVLFYRCLEKKAGRPGNPVPTGLAVFFSLSLLVGRSYQEIGGWDAVGQIQQVVGQAGYSMHHPLAHTLLMGG